MEKVACFLQRLQFQTPSREINRSSGFLASGKILLFVLKTELGDLSVVFVLQHVGLTLRFPV